MTRPLTLFLMNQKGYVVLQALVKTYPHLLETVISARDPNMQKDYYDEICAVCAQHDVTFHDRADSWPVESPFAIAIGWRWLIRLSDCRLVVFHDSLLPKYRGFNPLVSGLLSGDNQIGVTALFASESYDCGDIIAQSASSITYPIKIQQAFDIISKNYEELALMIATRIEQNVPLEGKRQDDQQASYSLWRDDDDYFIDWSWSAEYINRFVDAIGFPYKGAATLIEGRTARVLDVECVEDVAIVNRKPGKVIFIHDAKPVVVCGKGLLKINNLIDDRTNKPLLPLSKFRVRFK